MDDRVKLDPIATCLSLIAHGSALVQAGNLSEAERSLATAVVPAKLAPPEQGRQLVPLVLLNLSLLRQRQKRIEEARRFRADAQPFLEAKIDWMPDAGFQELMARVLVKLQEYRLAIPFCEQVIQLEKQWNDPILLAEALRRVGECYGRSGLKDQAAIPLRAAAKIFRNQPGDPRLSAVLIALGNALRKSAPSEAEACYREAADLYVAKAQLQSATAAWVNLGILCSEQGRHAESLKYYERVLQVREQFPGTPPSRMGSMHNNIANCYRRMGRFEEAFAVLDRAIKFLQPEGGALLASAYGTRGLIYRDSGHDREAAEWLRRAYEEHQKLSAPNLESVSEDLENEIAALKRLDREEDAAMAEKRLATVRATMAAIPQADRDLGTLSYQSQCAVLVEFGNKNVVASSVIGPERNRLARRLSEALQGQNVGELAGLVVIPESTTLMFYGPDAEELFKVLEPRLAEEPLCSGARITIRHSNAVREVFLPGQVM